eukprot:403368770
MLEPEIKYKMNRLKKKNRNNETVQGEDSNLNKKVICKHLKVKEYQCLDCNQMIPQFKSIFDTGNIQTYLNIKCINEFQDQVQSNNMGQLKGKSLMIYENYKPKNTQEMREYILFTIEKSLKKAVKQGILSQSMIKYIGQLGNIKNLSNELKSYIYVRKQREYNVISPDCSQNDQEKDGVPKLENQFNSIGPHCLLFDSFFECGNLEKAEYVSPVEYNLYLNVDTNTKGHQQWFYFKVKNTFKDKKYTFNIRNFTKPFTLYRSGMKIMMKSKKQFEESEGVSENEGWVTAGQEIQYWKTDIQRSGWRVPGPINLDDEEDDDQVLDDINGVDGGAALQGNQDSSKKNKNGRPSILLNQGLPQSNQHNVKRRKRYFYCLTFQVEFDYDDDVVYFAYSTPYPYSKIYLEMLQFEQQIIENSEQLPQLKEDLKIVESSDYSEREIYTRDIKYSRKFLCKTISGLPVPLISITSKANKGLEYKKRQAICITARVHPGETNSNFVFDGFLNFLITQDGIQQLLQNYIFKLIPCLNPDGNVCGNYRSSLAGVDLNRQWILPNKELHPSVFHAKEMLNNLHKERQILMYCDLHCHSKKKNSFIYGCNTAANGGFTSWTKVRLLPRILARQTALFNIKDCRFRVDPSKLGTARVIVWKEFGVTNSFTLENSFYGYNYGKDTILFKPKDYREIGQSLAKSIIQYRFLLKQIEKELALTNGWLKPKLLLEVTGTPAAEKIASEHAKKLKEERKRKQIEEYRINLGLDEISQFNEISIISSNKASEEKTRNVQRAKTLVQQIANSKIETLKKSATNQSDNIIERPLYVRTENPTSSVKNQVKKQFPISAVEQSQEMSLSQTKKFEITSEMNQSNDERIIKLQKFIKQYLKQKTTSKNVSNLLGKEGQSKSTFFPDLVHRTQTLQLNSNKNNEMTPKKPKQSMQQQAKLNLDNLKDSKDSSLGSLMIGRHRSKSMIIDDWRQFFNNTELEQVFEQIEHGQDPNEIEKQISDGGESESNISEDNLDIRELYKEIYMREHVMEKEILQLEKAEFSAISELKKMIEEGFHQQNEISQSKEKMPEIKIQDQKEHNQIQLQNGINIVSAAFNLQSFENQMKSQERLNKIRDINFNVNNEKAINDQQSRQTVYQGSQETSPQKQFTSQNQIYEYKGMQKYQNQASNSTSSRRPSSQVQAVGNFQQELGMLRFDNKSTSPHFTDENQREQYTLINQYAYKHQQNQNLNNKSRVIYQKQVERSPYQIQSIGKAQQSYFNNQKDSQQSRQMNKSMLTGQSDVETQNGFQQYILKNLRYEDPKVQQVYQKFKTSSNNQTQIQNQQQNLSLLLNQQPSLDQNIANFNYINQPQNQNYQQDQVQQLSKQLPLPNNNQQQQQHINIMNRRIKASKNVGIDSKSANRMILMQNQQYMQQNLTQITQPQFQLNNQRVNSHDPYQFSGVQQPNNNQSFGSLSFENSFGNSRKVGSYNMSTIQSQSYNNQNIINQSSAASMSQGNMLDQSKLNINIFGDSFNQRNNQTSKVINQGQNISGLGLNINTGLNGIQSQNINLPILKNNSYQSINQNPKQAQFILQPQQEKRTSLIDKQNDRIKKDLMGFGIQILQAQNPQQQNLGTQSNNSQTKTNLITQNTIAAHKRKSNVVVGALNEQRNTLNLSTLQGQLLAQQIQSQQMQLQQQQNMQQIFATQDHAHRSISNRNQQQQQKNQLSKNSFHRVNGNNVGIGINPNLLGNLTSGNIIINNTININIQQQ